MQARKCLIVFGIFLGMAGSAVAQMQMEGPPAFRGVWKPVVGSGAAYSVEAKGDPKREMEIAIVGSETVGGKTGHWLEMVIQDPEEGQIVIKHLIVLDEKDTRVIKMVFQKEGEQAMEMSMEMMGMMGGQQHTQDADIRDNATHLGTETITTPAGSFTCEHYRTKDGADVWVSEKVAPYGMVKMTSRDANMVLLRVLTGAKSRIKGTPKKFDFGEMMRERPE